MSEGHDDNQPLPEHKRKLIVLGVLAGIVIILFWLWTLPLNFHGRENDDGTQSLLTEVLTTVQIGRDRLSSSDNK